MKYEEIIGIEGGIHVMMVMLLMVMDVAQLELLKLDGIAQEELLKLEILVLKFVETDLMMEHLVVMI